METHSSTAGSEHAKLFRTPYIWWTFAVFYGFIFLLTAGTALNPSAPTLGRVACGVIAIAIAVVMFRARRAGIETSPRQVVVRQYSGRSFRIPWENIDSFIPVRASMFNNGVYIAVKTRDGRTVKTQGLGAPSRQGDRANRLLAELQAQRPS